MKKFISLVLLVVFIFMGNLPATSADKYLKLDREILEIQYQEALTKLEKDSSFTLEEKDILRGLMNQRYEDLKLGKVKVNTEDQTNGIPDPGSGDYNWHWIQYFVYEPTDSMFRYQNGRAYILSTALAGGVVLAGGSYLLAGLVELAQVLNIAVSDVPHFLPGRTEVHTNKYFRWLEPTIFHAFDYQVRYLSNTYIDGITYRIGDVLYQSGCWCE